MSHSLPTTTAIARIISGDVTCIGLLVNQIDLVRAAAAMQDHELMVKPSAVKHVLTALLQREINPDQAQLWASFVRRGYISTGEKTVTAIDISYQREYEDAIACAISRLDELGDIIDGTISDNELRELIDGLSSCGTDDAR